MTVSQTNTSGSAPGKAGFWFIVEGALLVVFGILAAALPAFAGLAAALVFGWVLILSGVVGFATLFMSRDAAHPVWSFVSALIALGAGILVFWAPVAGVVSLAILIAAYLLIDAIASIALAFDQRRRATKGWGWLILTGLINLVLAGFIALLRPHGDAVFIGFVIAIDLIAGGVALIGLAFAARR